MSSKPKMVISASKNKKQKILLIIMSLVLLLGIVIMLEVTNVTNFFGARNTTQTTSDSQATAEQKAEEQAANADAKQEYLDDTYKDKDNTPTPTPADDPSLTLTAKQEGSNVTVLTKIQSVAEGTCTLTATNGAKTTSQEAAVIYQPEFSSCAGFGVPISSLGTGTWNIKLTVSPTGDTEVSKSTTLEVR